jgi:pimeloyl-ACP methyl ester carboxylesterase
MTLANLPAGQNQALLDQRTLESAQTRRPARTVRTSSFFLCSVAIHLTLFLRRAPSGRREQPPNRSYVIIADLDLQIAGYDVRKRLSSVPSTIPVLVLHGTLDRRFLSLLPRPPLTLQYVGSVYFTESKYILAGIKHAQLLKFEGMGHMFVRLVAPHLAADPFALQVV